MNFMPFLISAIFVLGFASWSKCHASTLSINQSGATSGDDVTERESVNLSHRSTPPNEQPFSVTQNGEETRPQMSPDVNSTEKYQDLYKGQEAITNDDVEVTTWSTGEENTDQFFGITVKEGVIKFVRPFTTKSSYATNDATETTTYSAYDTQSTERTEGTETVASSLGTTESWTDIYESTVLNSDSTESQEERTDTTEENTQETLTTQDEGHAWEYSTIPYHDETSTQIFVPGDDTARESSYHSDDTSFEQSTLYYDQPVTATTFGYQQAVEQLSDSEISQDDVTDTVETTSQSEQTSLMQNSGEVYDEIEDKTEIENTDAISETESSFIEAGERKSYWSRLSETNQIEDDSDRFLKRKRKGRVWKDRIIDDMGFVVSHPESERLDEEDDLKIYEAVVTSMAQWELNKLQKKMKKGGKRIKRDEERVCYKDLGCFWDEGPFDYLDMLPSPPEEINTRFLLFTRERRDREKVIKSQNISTILDSHFNTSRPTKMLIHGFGSSCYSVWIREMKEIILKLMDVNIICVNWQKGAEVPNYVRAASNTRLVGRQVAVLIQQINDFLNTTLDDFHLIGFSLGAHVSGHAGAHLKNLSRISGLDPAGPLFESYSPSVRLDETDARFVDVIHTNADSLLMGGLGAFEAMGHVDFYPNGGKMQNGCANLFLGGVSDILWPTEGDGRYLCNHRRGYKYYMHSMVPQCKFPAFVCRDYETFLKGNCFPCKSCGSMGYFASEAEGRGQLYLVTRDTEPFCANQYKVSVKHSGGPPADLVTTYGRIEITFISSEGLNETLQLTQSDDMAMEAGSETVRILVPHPAMSDVVSVQLRYTAYQGWIYSGFARWAIDKISLMDSFGKTLSFCNRGTTLVTGQAMQFTLLPGDCTVLETQGIHSNNIQPFTDSLPEETENEVRQTSSLQIAVAPILESHFNFTKVNHGATNLTQPIPAPALSAIEAHTGGSITPGHGQVPLLPITLELPQRHHQEYPPNVYDASKPQRLPPLQSVGQRPPNNPHPSRYSGDPVKALTTPHSVLDIAKPEFAVSSEEPVSVIPAPNLAGLPRPIGIGHLQLPSNRYRPDAVRSPENIPFTPFVESISSTVSGELKGISTKDQSSTSKTPQEPESLVTFEAPGNVLSALHSTYVEVINSTTVKVTTFNQDMTEKSIFDNTFSPRTNGVLHGDRTQGFSSTTPLASGESSQSSDSPDSLITTTIKSTSPLLSTLRTPPSERLNLSIPLGTSATQQYGSFNSANEDDRLLSQTEHLYRPPPPTLKPQRIQSDLEKDIPTILDSNSLIDGEIPKKEAARALILDPLPSNLFKPETTTENKDRANCRNSSSCPPHFPFNISDRTTLVRAPNIAPSLSSSYPKILTYSLNSRPPSSIHVHSFQEGNPQRDFPTAADAPPEPRSSHIRFHFEDSEALSSEISARPDTKSPPKEFIASSDSQMRQHSSQSAPRRIPFDKVGSEIPSSRTRNLNFDRNAPVVPLPNLNPPPLETIVGRGRAPVPPSRYAQDLRVQSNSQNSQQNANQNVPEVGSPLSKHAQEPFLVRPQPFSHQGQLYPLDPQHNSNQEPMHRQSVSFSVGNVTNMSSDVTSESLSHSVPASAPFYVQILPPAFSQLPHLETYSLPIDARKLQDSSHRKRGGVGSRTNRGRSLPSSPVPLPSARGAAFKPLLLQLQDNLRGRYIPLRPPPENLRQN
ncbi:uncharacterized protein [Macrobrachium rosenbergii]|uniref:uncharacterized protein isoform X1 n=2 Tax=Macrobrachium rosenbergii TaxID=79674 RepID=UPI0034D410E6